MVTHEAVNLDCATTDPAELDEYAETLARLAEYSRVKACAMRHRLSGHIQAVGVLESECERIYSRLPEWAQW